MIKNTLTIAGVDPSGGAGVLADVKTMAALGTYACAVIAALTAQNTQCLTGIEPVSPHFLGLQIDTLFQDVRIDAVKIGMLGQAPIVYKVAEKMEQYAPDFVVLDPVMVAKSHDRLLEKKAISALLESMLPQAHMITPNLPEAGDILQQTPPENLKEMHRYAERLHRLMNSSGERWVLLKGGHLPSQELVDVLFNGDTMLDITHPRIDTKNTHGTGCSLSSAICALQAKLGDVSKATQLAIDYIHQALAHADKLSVGQGHGPIYHAYRTWQ